MTSTDDARAETWDQYVPTDLVNKVVNRLMRGGRDDLILANEVNTLLGASARRRAAAARAETTTATTEVERLTAERDALAARLAAVEAEHEALADSLRVEAAQIVSRVSDEPMRQPTPVDELLGIDPNDTAMRSAARAVQAQRQLTLLARRLAAVEAALANHPRVCDEHADDSPITCGWKRAVADIEAVLSAAPTDTTKETDR